MPDVWSNLCVEAPGFSHGVLHFDRTADLANAVIENSRDPGRLGRSAYTYYHIPMVAGIIVTAVGDELIISHPDGAMSVAIAAVVLGGPALFLAGHALFKLAIFDHLSVQRIMALGILAALIPVSFVVSPMILAACATLAVASVPMWDTWSLRHLIPPQSVAKAEEEVA